MVEFQLCRCIFEKEATQKFYLRCFVRGNFLCFVLVTNLSWSVQLCIGISPNSDLLFLIRVVTGSNLGPETGYPD
jgi:hypothetical protein